MAQTGSTTTACPDCGRPFTIAVTLHPRPDQQPDRSVLVDVKLNVDAEIVPRIVGDAPDPGGWIPTGTNGEGYWQR